MAYPRAPDRGVRTRVTVKEDQKVQSEVRTASCSESKYSRNAQLLRQHVQTPGYISENEEPQRGNARMDARRKREGKQRAPRGGLVNSVSAKFTSWIRRLDYLINVVIGVLMTALLMSWLVVARSPNPHASSVPVTAFEQARREPNAAISAFDASIDRVQGFNILSSAFPEPLPATVQDIPSMLSLARPLASAPGVAVFPYSGLPHALPSFPEDVARLIWIATPQSTGY